MNEYKKLFGQNLKQLRKARKMTQEDLASVTGLSLQYISEVERGIANPKLETILRIAAGLRVPPTELFYLQDIPDSPSVRRRKLVSILTNLDEHAIDTIYKFLLATTASYRDISFPPNGKDSDLDI